MHIKEPFHPPLPPPFHQALARLRLSASVAQSDVDEALRLMQMSKHSLYSEEKRSSGLDPISDVYSIIRDEAKRGGSGDVAYADALNWISRKVGAADAPAGRCQMADVKSTITLAWYRIFVSLYLCISVSVYLCIFVSFHLCIFVSFMLSRILCSECI